MIEYKLAKQYVDLGMSVFPVNLKRASDGKILKLPAVPWKAYQDRQPTPDELHTWFDSKHYNGIGLATGKVSGLVVVDVEYNATPEIKEKFDKAMYSRTISGGNHFFYKWTKELRNTVKIFNDQVDFRGDGGYVVLPDSQFGESGYKWEKGPIERMFLPELPEEIEKALTVRPETQVSNYEDVYSNGESIFRQAAQGERNMLASQIAGAILTSMPRRFWNPYGWFVLRDWNELNEPPLSDHELKIVWNSIQKAEKRKGIFSIVKQKFESYTGKEAKEKYNEVRAKYEGGMTTGIDVLDDYFTLLPGQLYLISAPTHQGKTTFALNIAAKVSTFGHKVVFASLEQSYQVVPRIETIIGGEIPDTFTILTTGEMLSVETFKAFCMENKPDLLVIDHIQFIQKAGKGQTEDMDEIILGIQQMAHEVEIPIIVVAHTRKINSESKKLTLDDLRSSSSLAQVPAVVCLMRRTAQEGELLLLSERGEVMIAKNRITGKLGVLPFTMKKDGQMDFSR